MKLIFPCFIHTSCARPKGGSQGRGFAAWLARPRLRRARLCRDTRRAAASPWLTHGRGHVPTTINIRMRKWTNDIQPYWRLAHIFIQRVHLVLNHSGTVHFSRYWFVLIMSLSCTVSQMPPGVCVYATAKWPRISIALRYDTRVSINAVCGRSSKNAWPRKMFCSTW